jgi:flagellar biosynthesis protein FliQ
MEPKEEPKDPNDPREYQSVPQGGLILLGQAIMVVVLMALCVGILVGGFRLHGAVEDVTLSLFGYVLAIVGGVAGLVVLFFGCCWLLPDVRKYWLRTVCGYRLACWREQPVEGAVERKLSFRVLAPGVELDSRDAQHLTLVLPLGGWFRRPYIMVPTDDRSHRLLRDVRVKIVHFALLVHRDGETKAIEQSTVHLTDRHGNRLIITVQQALELLELHGDNVLAYALGAWRSAFDLAYERSEAFGKELDRARQELRNMKDEREHANRMWRSALGEISAAIQRIKDTSRFGSSIEALRIRIYLLKQFRNLVPTPRPEEPLLQQWCTWAERELEAARADLARRERHKKARPATGAGA